MAIVLKPESEPHSWRAAFEARLPGHDVYLWPETPDPADVRYFVSSNPTGVELSAYPGLRAVLALSAGVERWLAGGMGDLPLVRLVDPAMSDEMAAYVVHWIVHFQKRMDRYLDHQSQALWSIEDYVQAADYPVGIVGFGTIGSHIAAALGAVGFPVRGWSRRERTEPGVDTFAGSDMLDPFLSGCAAVVNVLPATAATHHIIDANRFAAMMPGALYISLGRGSTTDPDALLAALDAGRVAAAVLDVTDPEPLPSDHALWQHLNVRITPHIAGFTMVRTATDAVAANIERIEAGEAPFPMVDTGRGY